MLRAPPKVSILCGCECVCVCVCVCGIIGRLRVGFLTLLLFVFELPKSSTPITSEISKEVWWHTFLSPRTKYFLLLGGLN